MRTKITVGSRGSQLAMIQTRSVVAKIKQLNPNLEVSIQKIVTAGDRDHHTSLDRIGVAVFVKELEEALLDKRIDLAVHSLKDMPTDIPQGLSLLAVLEREDPRDALVARAGLDNLPGGATIGTDSLRRSIQLAQRRPDLKVGSIRGNVDTRLRKVAQGEFDGVIVAAAALARLGWSDRITEYLPMKDFLPAVGQGALAIEGRLDEDIAALVAPLKHLSTWQAVLAERAYLRALGGGCRAPIAALGTVEGNMLKLEGMVAGDDVSKVLRNIEVGTVDRPEEVGTRLAERMLSMGASQFIAEVKSREGR
ncbi:MAG: hydroxymethylbilane synthase [Dehalococcoidales bacterium]|nr:hydroxymethylbilane synthase [Dehalococcoidales bacterium]